MFCVPIGLTNCMIGMFLLVIPVIADLDFVYLLHTILMVFNVDYVNVDLITQKNGKLKFSSYVFKPHKENTFYFFMNREIYLSSIYLSLYPWWIISYLESNETTFYKFFTSNFLLDLYYVYYIPLACTPFYPRGANFNNLKVLNTISNITMKGVKFNY